MVYRKYDESLHWHYTMRRLGEDEHGVWLGSPPGSSGRRGSEPPVRYDHGFVMLIPTGTWWTAIFNDDAHPRTEIYCDIGTVPEWRDGEVTMVDLDLDVVRGRDGRVEIVDQDEFAEHRVRYGYPPEIIDGAERAAGWLRDRLEGAADPFGYRRWLAMIGS